MTALLVTALLAWAIWLLMRTHFYAAGIVALIAVVKVLP